MLRYLTPPAKAKELQHWTKAKRTAAPSPGRADDGLADTEIVPLCDQLNAIDGLCTLQSCAGHDAPGNPPHLWLWLSEEMSAKFNLWGSVLARMPGIEDVSRKYTPWGHEVAAIVLDGRIDTCSDSLLLFFAALSQTDRFQPVASPDTHCQVRQASFNNNIME